MDAGWKEGGGKLPKKSPRIEFNDLKNVNKEDILGLMNNPLVLRQIPLAKGRFDDDYEKFLAAKKQS